MTLGVVSAIGVACASAPRSGEPPMPFRARQVIVAVPLSAPPILSDRARELARAYDIRPLMGFPLETIDLHCLVFEVKTGRSIDRLLRALSAHPGVVLAQRNQRFVSSGRTGDDPYAGLQHAHRKLRVRDAHRFATGRGVRVAIVDTAVDLTHPDLEARIVAQRDFVERVGQVSSRRVHGTAVAGVVAARANDGVGIRGVAPDADLVGAGACWDREGRGAVCSSWTLAMAVDYAVALGVDVVNLSLSGPPDPLFEAVLRRADAAGIVLVGAAVPGASGDLQFPAGLDFVIAVGDSDAAAGAAGALLSAPGQEILTTAPRRSYGYFSGSSFSAAHVSGAAALLLEKAPESATDQIVQWLSTTVEDEPTRSIDLCRALDRQGGRDHCRAPGPEGSEFDRRE